jgi:hypothetical protein
MIAIKYTTLTGDMTTTSYINLFNRTGSNKFFPISYSVDLIASKTFLNKEFI